MSRKESKKKWRQLLAIESTILNDDTPESTVDPGAEDKFDPVCENNEISSPVPSEDISLACQGAFDFNSTASNMDFFVDGEDIESDDCLVLCPSENESVASSDDPEVNLAEDLAVWASHEPNMPRSAVTHLLKVLVKYHPELRRDARTLLSCQGDVSVSNIAGGDFIYLGIQNQVIELLNTDDSLISNTISLNISIDGLPLFKSSTMSLWPILGKIFNHHEVFIIALYCGPAKPNNIEEFLEDFLDEYSKLKTGGFDFQTYQIKVKINAIICDAPARQLLKQIKAHNSYSGCERCTAVGTSIEHRMIFHSIDDEKRNDEMFQTFSYPNHQIANSPLLRCSISCVNEFRIDYMHLVLLGVMRRILMFLLKGPRKCRISSRQASQISNNLTSFNGKIPKEFARQPRSLVEIKRWKATEQRQFLLYTGPVSLKGIIAEEPYTHFLALIVSMRIFLDENDEYRCRHLDYADQLIRYFVSKSPSIYGSTFCVYNVHNLIHLKDDAVFFGCLLDKISCFPFENYMRIMKRYVRKPSQIIPQVVNCKTSIKTGYKSMFSQSTKIAEKGTKDTWFILSNGNFIKILSSRNNGFYQCEVYPKRLCESFFNVPCDSRIVGIYQISQKKLSKFKVDTISKSRISRKAVCLPINGNIVLISFLHNFIE